MFKTKEEKKAYEKVYYQKNKKKERARHYIQYLKNKQKILKKAKEKYSKNRVQIILKERKRHQLHRHLINKIQSFKARISRKEAEKIPKECELCKEKREYVLHWHHRDFNSKNNKISNIQVLCANCHMEVHHLERQKYLII